MTMDSVEIVQDKRITLSVTRKVSPKQYESLEVGAFYPIDVPERTAEDTPASHAAAVAAAIQEGFALLRVQVYDQLGIEYTDDKGIIKEKVTAHFTSGSAPKAPATSARPAAPTPTSAPASSAGTDGTACPKCGGSMWDNRTTKTNPKQPDFKCKNKDACNGAIWPPRGH